MDLNLGCPQGIARKGHYGSFLMHDKDTVRALVTTLATHLRVPVTVKIRVFPDDTETLEFVDMLQAAGCDLLTVHGRTKEMNKTLVRQVNWDIIRQIKARLTIPVIANGGIETYADVAQCLEATGCDGVMSSEAILENPAFFSPSSTPPSFVQLARHYLDCVTLYPPASAKMVRAHLFKILYQDLRVHVDLRDALANAKSQDEMVAIVDQVTGRLQHTEPRTRRYARDTSWYRRHRQAQEKRTRRASFEKCLDTGFGHLFA